MSASSGWDMLGYHFHAISQAYRLVCHVGLHHVTPLNQWISVALMAAFIVTRSGSMEPSISCTKWAVAVEAVEVDTCGYLELRV